MKIAFSYTDSTDYHKFKHLALALKRQGHSVFCLGGGDPEWIDSTRLEKLLNKDSLVLHKTFGALLEVDIVISTGRANSVRDCRAKKYVKLFSDIGDTGSIYEKSNTIGFDFILAPGNRAAHLIKQNNPTVPIKSVGFPMLDRAFGKAESSIYEICYVPTWNQFTTIGILGEAIAQLSIQYPGQCLFMPHPYLLKRSPDWASFFKDYGWEIPSFYSTVSALARKCTIMMVDENSNAAWESAMLNESTVVCRNSDAPEISTAREIAKFVHVVETPEDVLSLTEYFPGAKAIPQSYCSYRGLSVERCVDVLEEFWKNQM